MLDSHLTDPLQLFKKQPQYRSKAEIDLLVQFTQELPFFKQYQKQDNGVIIHRECCKYMFIENLRINEVVFHVDIIKKNKYMISCQTMRLYNQIFFFNQNQPRTLSGSIS